MLSLSEVLGLNTTHRKGTKVQTRCWRKIPVSAQMSLKVCKNWPPTGWDRVSSFLTAVPCAHMCACGVYVCVEARG